MHARRGQRPAPGPVNPFAPPAPRPVLEQGALGADELLGPSLALRGPSVPLGIAPAPGDLERLPVRRSARTPTLWVLGVHGGAGATTVTLLVGDGAVDAEGSWPLPPEPEGDEPAASGAASPADLLFGGDQPVQPSPVLLVARTHAAGLHAAAAAARTWASGYLGAQRLLGLVLVDDGPDLPKPLVRACTRVGRMTPSCWHLPWRESWRGHVTPPADDVPLRVRRTVADIRTRAARAQQATTAIL